MEVYSLPYDDTSNKYFVLWRGALERAGVSVHAVPKNSLMRLLTSRITAETILAIHWSTTWYGSKSILKSLFRLMMNGCMIIALKLRGVKILWVVHNSSAHDYPHPRIDAFGRWCTAQFAEVIIAQQGSTQATLASEYPGKKVVCIPHGNYVGAYGPRVENREEVRKESGYTTDDIVLLAVGTVRPYKKIEKIIEALGEAHDSRIRLCIAGKAPADYAASLRDAVARKPAASVRFENRFIPDAELPKYLACADYAVFFYDDTELTSGGILLALSYGIPVISRTIAGAYMIQDQVNGYTFNDYDSLVSLLSRLAILPRPDSQAAIDSVSALDWDMIARTYVAAISPHS